MNELPRWLLEEDVEPSEAERLAFAEIPPPEALLAQTLAAVAAERASELPEAVVPLEPLPAPANRQRWLWLGAGVAAALALLAIPDAPLRGDPANMTIRGVENGGPEVSLKMAARRGERLERLREGEVYAPGDALFFRVQTAGPGWVYLIHASPGGVEVLDGRAVPAGELDLDRDGEPLAWTLDANDQDTAFALLTSKDERPPARIEAMLEERLNPALRADPEAICAAARSEGLGCDGTRVEVEP